MIAFIPARGGSKGLPKKNVKVINGQPLIAWTLRAAIDSSTVDSVYVSTDDKEIAEISRARGANVVIRPDDISGDDATTEAAIQHFIDTSDHIDHNQKICLLQCTSPIRRKGELDDMCRFHENGGYDSTFAACEVEQFLWRYDSELNVGPINYDYNSRPRRQDRKKTDAVLAETGASYIFPIQNFVKEKSRLHGKIGAFVVPTRYAKEIDSMEDFHEAEAFLRLEEGGEKWSKY